MNRAEFPEFGTDSVQNEAFALFETLSACVNDAC
jgi:hypothetical protein